jgi:hypothetical protein
MRGALSLYAAGDERCFGRSVSANDISGSRVFRVEVEKSKGEKLKIPK